MSRGKSKGRAVSALIPHLNWDSAASDLCGRGARQPRSESGEPSGDRCPPASAPRDAGPGTSPGSFLPASRGRRHARRPRPPSTSRRVPWRSARSGGWARRRSSPCAPSPRQGSRLEVCSENGSLRMSLYPSCRRRLAQGCPCAGGGGGRRSKTRLAGICHPSLIFSHFSLATLHSLPYPLSAKAELAFGCLRDASDPDIRSRFCRVLLSQLRQPRAPAWCRLSFPPLSCRPSFLCLSWSANDVSPSVSTRFHID
jgi:hypothetical protein